MAGRKDVCQSRQEVADIPTQRNVTAIVFRYYHITLSKCPFPCKRPPPNFDSCVIFESNTKTPLDHVAEIGQFIQSFSAQAHAKTCRRQFGYIGYFLV